MPLEIPIFPILFVFSDFFGKAVVLEIGKKVISLASVRISHTSLGTQIVNPECSPVAKVTKIHGFIFGICYLYAALAYSISVSPLALT